MELINKVLISGRSLAGKDVIADYLVEKYGFVKISFAYGIYNIAHEYFGMKSKDRKLLQSIGEKLREIDPDVWVRHTLQMSNNFEKIVISDCRRLNEYNYAVANGFIPIRVSAKYDTRIERAIKRDGEYPDTSLWVNDSETGSDHCKFIHIENNSTLDDVHSKIDDLLTHLDEYPMISGDIIEEKEM